MALFGFGKKKEEQPPAEPYGGTPTELVIQMRQQGLSNNQIVQTLQKQGYSSSQIFDAMSQADIKGIVEQAPAPAPPLGPMPRTRMQVPAPAPQPAPAPPVMPAPAPETPRERIEEIAETIIDEKWEELMKNVEKIVTWKDATESRITRIEESIADLKKSFDELHRGILGKISEYDKGIRNVGTDIKAMQEVFKKVLPQFTENVSELGRITKTIKKKK